ncbi:branched-chain amino acid ABC transporter permease [uncultured Tyzzerella sp.]|uniref:branched-chain amino acid ABC transporter permease n=1 Tax=uncultured Tyzzerella sp. TaxID=2321398 RepID=UPI0029422E57|nr:branched-chain amino acid ABC transporter permease [uncultured Tyzzerella sp.]
MDFFNQLINGISIGSVYALVALGYTMVYGIVKLINFAHGDVIMLGSYFILIFTRSMGMPFWLSVIASMLFCAIFGILIEKVAYKPLRKAPRISALITAIGVSILLQNIVILIKPDPLPFPNALAGSVRFLGIDIGYVNIITIIVSFTIMIFLTLFIKYTKWGKAMRAVSEDEGASTLMGINVNNTIALTFAIGSALAAVGGGLYGVSYKLIEPTIGSVFGLKAFIAAVIGGIGTIPGAVIGGLIMGLVETFTKAYISTNLTDVIVFAVLILILLIKPSGLLGKNVKEKV